MIKLSEVLEYHNQSIIKQFCFENPSISTEEANFIFKDLLAWLWLSVHRNQKQYTTHMIAALHLLDKMWHVFILHTKDYMDFCHRYFDAYLHHEIEPLGDEYTISPDELSEFLNECYDHLGEGWLLQNFSSVLSADTV